MKQSSKHGLREKVEDIVEENIKPTTLGKTYVVVYYEKMSKQILSLIKKEVLKSLPKKEKGDLGLKLPEGVLIHLYSPTDKYIYNQTLEEVKKKLDKLFK